jgi:hypothetical protein
MKFFFSKVSYKTLAIKSVVFMIPWTIALFAVNYFWPHLIESEKIVTNIFSNSIVFLLGYILTMIGFRYSSKDEKKVVQDDEAGVDSPSVSGSRRIVPGTEFNEPRS